ncbi:serpin A12-like [Sorex fumeus]|uniref:serpin A12-like n=1 Tax=Sorex fumeus TaxID=62283 RepID=UPI0024AD408A|nr:serpin A12-like [Sorex fumeus]
MNPTLGLGLLMAGLLTGEGLVQAGFSPKVLGAWKGRAATQELSRRNTDFGFKLFKKLTSRNPTNNIFISPLSISTAFSMLCLGAQDSTLAEIKEGFNLQNLPDRTLHEGFRDLIRRLDQTHHSHNLDLENALFIDRKLQPQQKFLDNAKNLYSAETITTNFQDLKAARREINDFVRQKTRGNINELIRHIMPGTLMLLTNCLFFRGRWQQEFDPKATKEEDFLLDGDQTVTVSMMHHGGMYEAGRDDQLPCSILEMPFQDNISAIFILPDEGKMKEVEEALSANTFDRWRSLLSRRVTNVALPRFSISGTYDLKKTLSYLGIRKIFEEHGDLTRISPHQNLKIGEAVHKAKLKMDEQGAEAAASSGAQTLPMEKPFSMKMNRPFLLAIKEKTVPAVLFLGKLTNPSGK